jgi:CDP-glucose 4,6-dehydratase
MDFTKAYKGKKVFITGHTGFKGSWLLTWLHSLGAEIKGYSLEPLPEHKLYGQIHGDSLCIPEFNDILHYEDLKKSLLEFRPDIIFHLAAQPIVRTSYQAPVETFAINGIGTANLLNIVRSLEQACNVVLITTDKVYQNNEWPYAYRESEKLGGLDPYSASKACAELIIESFRHSYFNPAEYSKHRKSIAVARAGNVIGGGDWAKDRILPDIIRALQQNQPVAIRNPDSVRPWQHVLEPLSGYLLLGKKMMEDPVKYSTAYNFGPLTIDCWRVEKMVERAIVAWGSGNYHIVREEGAPHEAGLLKLDVNKAEHDLQWRPVMNASDTIWKAVNWYKNFDGSNARELIQQDINSFIEKSEAADR